VRILFIQLSLSGIFGASGYILRYYATANDLQTVATYLALVARNLVNASSFMMMTYVSELLPTFLRSTGVGIGYFASRFGNAVSPQILFTLDHIWQPLPHVVYGGLLITSSIIVCFLPETFSRVLPQTIEDVENLKKSTKTRSPNEKSPLLENGKNGFNG